MALHAIVTAGGKLPAELHPHSDSKVKALLQVNGRLLLEHAVHALLESDRFARVVVVGNDEVQEALPQGSEHVVERTGLAENIHAGFEHLGGERHDYLVVSPDLPFICGPSLIEFLDSAPASADMAFPYVSQRDFIAHFPGVPNDFVRMDGEHYTMGSCAYMTGPILRSNIPLARDFYKARKSPLKMAVMMGFPVAWGFLTGRLRLAALEHRAARLTGGEVRGVQVTQGSLAYDVDNRENFEHAERLHKERLSGGSEKMAEGLTD